MRITFLVPGPISAISGGYSYDRRMIAGLEALGHSVRVVELGGRHPRPDAAAEALLNYAREGNTAQLEAQFDAGASEDVVSESGDSLLMLAAYHGTSFTEVRGARLAAEEEAG